MSILKLDKSKRIIILLSFFSFLIWASLGILAPIEVLFLGSLIKNVSIKGLILAIPSLILLIFSPYIMKFSDKHGRKKVIITLILISSPFFILLPFSQSYYMYSLLKIFSALMFLASPIVLAYISDTVKKLGIGYGFIILASSIGGSFGPFISGTLGEIFGLTVPYFIITVLTLFSLIFILPLDELKSSIKPEKIRKVKKLDFLLLAVLINGLIFSLHFSARNVVWPILLESITNAPAMFAGLIFSFMGITATILSLPSGILSEKFGEKKIFFIGWSIMGIIGLLLFYVTKNLYLFIVFSILFAVGEILRGPSSNIILAKYKKSIYFGYHSSLCALGGIIGAIISAFLIDFIGISITVLMLGFFVLLSLAPFLLIYLKDALIIITNYKKN
ncbi:MAG: MFS transporter [Candidatus Woesearchaeota archaeon]|nr:MAG: MFS transporter [Candidatus Woesearchaeota archaeon]